MSGFENSHPGKFALTGTKAEYWLKEYSGDPFDVVRDLLRDTLLLVEDHPGTGAALLISGGRCIPWECSAELFGLLRNPYNFRSGMRSVFERHERRCRFETG